MVFRKHRLTIKCGVSGRHTPSLVQTSEQAWVTVKSARNIAAKKLNLLHNIEPVHVTRFRVHNFLKFS